MNKAEKNLNNVNFFVKYISPNSNTEKSKKTRAYYSSNQNKDYMNYILTGISDMKKMDYMEYMNNKEKSYGVFNYECRRKKASKTKFKTN